MILRKLQISPEKMIPLAMALIVVGLSMTVIGIAIVLEIAGVVLAAKAAAAKNCRAL